MQTFVPCTDFYYCAVVLDRQRLGKQRVECVQILKALARETTGWRNHPATLMWSGFEPALCVYAFVVIEEWVRRGYQDGCFLEVSRLAKFFGSLDRCLAALPCQRPDPDHPLRRLQHTTRSALRDVSIEIPPWWLGPIHRSHRRSLIYRKPEHYQKFWPQESASGEDEPLFWPTLEVGRVSP